MAKRFSKNLVAAAGLIVLASCGGQTTETAAQSEDTPEQLALSDESADGEQGTSQAPTDDSTPEAPVEEVEAPEETTTTTTTTAAPVSGFTAEEAIEDLDEYVAAIDQYAEIALVTGELTFEQSEEIFALLDQSLIGGDPAEEVLTFHACNAEGAILARSFYAIESVDFEFEHIAQTQINETSWALEIREFVQISGLPESVSNNTIIVTIDGVGPEVQAGEDQCAIPNSAKAEALLAEAREVLGLANADTAENSDELRLTDEARAEEASAASTQGTIGEAVDLGDGLSVNVRSLSTGSRGNRGVSLVADLRVENTGEDTHIPSVRIFCAGNPWGGPNIDGTFDSFGFLQTNTVNEGTIDLLLPGESNIATHVVPVCETPAVVRVAFPFDDASADFPIPDELIAELNG